MNVPEPRFLDWDTLLDIHADSLAEFGGSEGIRDRGTVESALNAAQFAYHYGQRDLFELAACYAFHIAEAQAFLDGNKRTAIVAALTFLQANGLPDKRDDGTLYDAMIAIAEKRMSKAGLADALRSFHRLA